MSPRKHRRPVTSELVITFVPGLGRGDREARVPAGGEFAWLRELVELWSHEGGSIFATNSTPLTSFGAEVSDGVHEGEERELVSMSWIGVPGLSSSWTVVAIELAPAARLYAEWRGSFGLCLLGYSDDPDATRSDEAFLAMLFAENGMSFGTTVMYGLPSEASSCLPKERLAALLASAVGAGDWWDERPDDPLAAALAIVRGK